MTDLLITGARLVREIEGFDWVVGESGGVDAGQYARLNTTTSKAELGNATTAGEVGILGGMVTNPDRNAGQTAHITTIGIIDVGDALDALDYDAPVYISDTNGAFTDDPLDATVDTIVGNVIGVWTGTTADKLLLFTGVRPS